MNPHATPKVNRFHYVNGLRSAIDKVRLGLTVERRADAAGERGQQRHGRRVHHQVLALFGRLADHVLRDVDLPVELPGPGGLDPGLDFALLLQQRPELTPDQVKYHHDLALRNAKIRVSVLCPGWVKTRIAEAERHRPADERIDLAKLDRVTASTGMSMYKAVKDGTEPGEIAEALFTAVREERFYIITHPQTMAGIRIRMDDILQERQPTLLPI